ncbi:MAG: alpha-ketoacid dehydrogenase subunit beta [Thermaerobacter sp.]|nr:alpha-ketoacid dehydrogenase subunit beta [Bacillota bacterium]REJ37701.1 MAG: alpha-ketoacid dehydrogenase subunit beta [Bacillota bacterium]
MARRTLIQAINEALRQEMRRDDRIVLLGEDVGRVGGVFRATEGLQQEFGPDRVIDTPLAESAIIGAALGMAVYGLIPVPEIQFDGFLPPAFDHIISHVARIRNRSRGRFTAPMVIRVPHGGGIRALEHHSEAPETFYTHIPGIKVVIPATAYDAKGLLISAIRDPDPVIFFEPKRIYRAFREEVPEEPYTVPLGKARVAREGNDVTLIAWGAMVHVALAAAEKAAAEHGWSCEVLDLRTLSPLDIDAIIASVQKTGRCVVVHEAPRQSGFGGEIAALIGERALLYLEAPVVRVTGFDTAMPYFTLEDYYLPSPERVLKGIAQVMNF